MQENERNLALRAELDKVGSLLSRLGEQDAIVGHNTNLVTIKVSKTSDQSLTIKFLKFLEARSIEYTRQNFVHVKVFLVIARNNTVEFVG